MQKAEFYHCEDITDRELTLMFQAFIKFCSGMSRTQFSTYIKEKFPKFRYNHLEYYSLEIDGKPAVGVHAHRGWQVRLDLTKVHPLYRMDFYPRCFETKEEAEKELKYIRENALFTSYHHIPPEAYVVEDF